METINPQSVLRILFGYLINIVFFIFLREIGEGRTIQVPDDVEVVDASGKLVMPGNKTI